MWEELVLKPRGEDVPPEADFSIVITDSAMEPLIPRGSRVYVSSRAALKELDTGLFLYEGRVRCRRWCEDNDLLSPIYTTATRGGCWFCHNQGVGQLRLLRKNYPELWALMLKWDKDSPVTFKADGHTVHDFDQRFHLEGEGLIYPDDKIFRWSMLDDELNYRWF